VKVPFVDMLGHSLEAQAAIESAALRVLRRGNFILGEEVERFEAQFTAFCEAEGVEAIGVSSGTDALLVSLMACGVGAGDEVIVPDFTYVAPASCVQRLGATCVLVDIDETYCMDVQALEGAITERTRAIIPVHLFGQMANMPAIMQLAADRNIHVIEDSAQAIGARLSGKHAGTFGRAGCFSFFPTKNLGGAGDGGMILSRDSEFAERIRWIRSQGSRQKYFHEVLGGNFRLDALQAAILGAKIEFLEGWNVSRRANAEAYLDAFDGVPGIKTPAVREGVDHAWHQFSIEVDDRDALRAKLQSRGVETQVYYPWPLHVQPILKRGGAFPNASRAAHSVVSLPVSHHLSASQREWVVSSVLEVIP